MVIHIEVEMLDDGDIAIAFSHFSEGDGGHGISVARKGRFAALSVIGYPFEGAEAATLARPNRQRITDNAQSAAVGSPLAVETACSLQDSLC